MVWILTDAMDRFQGVFKSAKDARNMLYGKHGENVTAIEEDVDGTWKIICTNGEEYTIKAYIPK